MSRSRIPAMLLALCLLLTAVMPVSAAERWQSYVYDTWGNSIPAPLAYTVDEVYSGQRLGTTALEDPQDVFVATDGDVYIVDKGRNAIFHLTGDLSLVREIGGFTDENGSQTFAQPTGVFVDEEGCLYVADSGNQRVVKLSPDLTLLQIFGRPDTDLLDDNTEYRPLKVVVDSIDNVYVVAYGIYQGFVKYDTAGNFEGFFGGNEVEVTAQLVLERFWKKLFTEEQLEASSRSIPIEYSNAVIDSNNFIYAVVLQTSTSLDEVKKLNAQGKNVLTFSDEGTHYDRNDFGDIEKDYTATTTYVDNRMVDMAVGDDGIMAVLDGERGHVFVYDRDMNLLFTFGEKGDERGEFSQPVSIARQGDGYLVVDASKKCVIRFTPTAYARQVCEAMTYYSDGKYVESVVLWEEVLRKNANCRIAYKSIGKAYLQQGRYQEAMVCFENADDKTGYSDAWEQYRKELIRENLVWIVIGLVAAGVGLSFLLRLLRRFFRLGGKKRKTTFR